MLKLHFLPTVSVFALTALITLSENATAAAITGVNYNFSGTQSSAADPAVLNSITVNSTVFAQPVFPVSYTNIDLAGTAEIRLNTVGQGVTPSDGTAWETEALAAFQSRNLNHYQQLDDGNLDATWRLDFGNTLPTTGLLFLTITERNRNNPLFIEAFDSTRNSLGSISMTVTDLSPTGAISAGTNLSSPEDITAATFPVSDLLGSSTSQISYLEITNNFNNSDGADGKVIFWSNISVIPEPGSSLLLGLSAFALLIHRRRSK